MRGVTLEEAVQKTWDSLSPEQREFWSYGDLACYESSYIPVLEMLKSYNEWRNFEIDTIIDVGCNWGTQSFQFHQLGYRYFGIDYNTSDHAFIGPDTDNVQFFDADATKMNFKKFNQKYNINKLSTLVICAYLPMLKHQVGYESKRSNVGAKFMTKMLKYYSKYIIL